MRPQRKPQQTVPVLPFMGSGSYFANLTNKNQPCCNWFAGLACKTFVRVPVNASCLPFTPPRTCVQNYGLGLTA